MTDIISSEVMDKRRICTIDLTEAFKTINECIAPKFGDALKTQMAELEDWDVFHRGLNRYVKRNKSTIVYDDGVEELISDCRVMATKIFYEIKETLLEKVAAKADLWAEGVLADILGHSLIDNEIPTPCLKVEPRKAVLAKLPNVKHEEPQIGGELVAPNDVMANDTKSADSPSIFNPMPDTSEVPASSKTYDVSVSGGTSEIKSQCEPNPSMARTDGLLTSTDATQTSNDKTESKASSGKMNYSITPNVLFVGISGDDSYFTSPFNWSRAFSQSKWEKTPDDKINEFKEQIAGYARRLEPTAGLTRIGCIRFAQNTPEFTAFKKSAQKLLGNYSQSFTDLVEAESSSTLVTISSMAERTAIKTFALDKTISLRFLMRIARLTKLRLAPYGGNYYGDSEHGKKCLEAVDAEKLSILNDEEWVEHQKTILLSYLNDTLSLWWEHLQLGRPLEQPPVVLNSNNEALNA